MSTSYRWRPVKSLLVNPFVVCWWLGCIICGHVHESIKDCVSECAQVPFSGHRLNILPECPHSRSSSGLSLMPVLWVVPLCWRCICSTEMEEAVHGDRSKESNPKLRHPNSFLCCLDQGLCFTSLHLYEYFFHLHRIWFIYRKEEAAVFCCVSTCRWSPVQGMPPFVS